MHGLLTYYYGNMAICLKTKLTVTTEIGILKTICLASSALMWIFNKTFTLE